LNRKRKPIVLNELAQKSAAELKVMVTELSNVAPTEHADAARRKGRH
jgi:hypothetical protein